jgi:hypothetical protein
MVAAFFYAIDASDERYSQFNSLHEAPHELTMLSRSEAFRLAERTLEN